MKLPKNIAVTGRIKDWLNNSANRLPVSCTVLSVKDSMEGKDGIEDSWNFTSKALRNGAGVAIDLSQLRPKGTDNGRGLTASGAVSFAGMYSHLNEILRRGGTYKNGAVTLYLDYDHPDTEEYLSLKSSELAWAKRALYVDRNLLNSPLLSTIISHVSNGSIWLAKKRWDVAGNRLYSQVCMEIALPSRGTCLLAHVNLGFCTIEEIPQTFEDGMRFLCEIHSRTGAGESGIYLSPQEDKQVGLGCLGLANLLAIEGISYASFVSALEYVISGDWFEFPPTDSKALKLARYLQKGFLRGMAVATEYGMERAFTIAPTASCSYRYRDRDGYTTSPEISPPVCHPLTKEVHRDSGTFGVIPYQYHPKTETAEQVGWDVQYRLMKTWQKLMDSAGLAHAISFNLWDTCEVSEAFIKDWLESPLWTTYYRLNTRQYALDKSQVITCDDEVCVVCAE